MGIGTKTGKYNRISATALGYDPDRDNAPVVIASGRGKIAEAIILAARDHNIPILPDPILAESLSRVNVNQAIPPELYIVVAEIFAYVYRIQTQHSLQRELTTNGKSSPTRT
jgi:flagellar biosynthesis protein